MFRKVSRALHTPVYVLAMMALSASAGFSLAMALVSADALPEAWWRSAEAGSQVTEDSVGWDCRTMGNKVCGWDVPQLPPDWDLTDPYDRCLAAMADAEIPADQWDCYEYPRERP